MHAEHERYPIKRKNLKKIQKNVDFFEKKKYDIERRIIRYPEEI